MLKLIGNFLYYRFGDSGCAGSNGLLNIEKIICLYKRRFPFDDFGDGRCDDVDEGSTSWCLFGLLSSSGDGIVLCVGSEIEIDGILLDLSGLSFG
jgi:hypothetical protein